MPTVSVIVPNYNHARYLRKRLDSIIAQTYQDFELILLDDCSTDESREILRSYAADPRVRMEFNENNGGNTFAQWNKGVRIARGRYVWIAESDDYADGRLLELLTGILERDDAVTMAYCRSHRVGPEGEQLGFADRYLEGLDAEHWKEDFVADGREECRRYFVVINPIHNASAVVFRRSVYEKVGGADEQFRISGDFKLWASLAMNGKIAYVAEPLNYYRTHRENVRTWAETIQLGDAEHFCALRWLLSQLSPGEPEPPHQWNDHALNRPPSELTPQERLQFSVESLAYALDWNSRHGSPLIDSRSYFLGWEFALTEREFCYVPPGRWQYFVHKIRFYRHYFQAMDWKWRLTQPIRMLGALVLGYRHKNQGQQVWERMRQAAESLQRKASKAAK